MIPLNQIPNLITVARMVLLVPLLYTMLEGYYVAAFYIFSIAGLSDGIDGFLARRFNWISRLGSFIDPAADKFLMLISFVTLAYLGHLPWVLVGIVVGRDVIIFFGVIAVYIAMGHVEFDPSRMSKWNTVLQIALVFFVLFGLAYQPLPAAFILGLMLVVIASSLISLVSYMWVWTLKVVRPE